MVIRRELLGGKYMVEKNRHVEWKKSGSCGHRLDWKRRPEGTVSRIGLSGRRNMVNEKHKVVEKERL